MVCPGISPNLSGKRVTPKDLCDAVAATRETVAGHWLHIPGGGAYCPKCGEPQTQVAVELLRMLEPAPAKDPLVEGAGRMK